MKKNSIKFLPVGNGDCAILRRDETVVMTDIRYRESAADDSNDEAPDIGPDIRDACPDHHLDLFVLTHPDEDHCAGFDRIFHTGKPEKWDDDPDEGDPLILVDEIWCSDFAVKSGKKQINDRTLIKEIKRRQKLIGTVDESLAGNRLRFMDVEDSSGSFGELDWEILAPNHEEKDPAIESEDEESESNRSSVVMRWSITVGGVKNHIMLLGDAPLSVLERIHDETAKEDLEWNVLMAPHHCSRRSLGSEGDNGFEYSSKALDVLGHQKGSGFVVSSSKYIKVDDDRPPSHEARDEYYKILGNGEITSEAKKRFLCTGGNDKDDPASVVIEFTPSGPSFLKVAGSISAPAIASSSVGAGGSYA